MLSQFLQRRRDNNSSSSNNNNNNPSSSSSSLPVLDSPSTSSTATLPIPNGTAPSIGVVAPSPPPTDHTPLATTDSHEQESQKEEPPSHDDDDQMARSNSTSGHEKGRSESTIRASSTRRSSRYDNSEDGHGGKMDVASRHEMMRRVMVEGENGQYARAARPVSSSSNTSINASSSSIPTASSATSLSADTPVFDDKPGEGSLALDAFTGDGTDVVTVEGAPMPINAPSIQRPGPSSRNSSFGELDGTDELSPSERGHGRYATTMTAVDRPTSSRSHSGVTVGSASPNLATPTRPEADPHQQGQQQGSALLSPPLSRVRRQSSENVHGSPAKKKHTGQGGIAGAIASSGMAGMGIGASHAATAARERLPAASKDGPPSRRASAVSSASVDPDAVDGAARSDHMLGVEHTGGGAYPRSPRESSGGLAPPPLTPNGIGAVGGLSPSGLGEHVGILDGAGASGAQHATDWPHDMGAQITGFAVASSKRNNDFHALFQSVPEDDYLVEDYGCANVREILIQGRIYISENHVCFNANIFGWVTNVILPFSEIVSIEKRMTAFVIPNAIQIATLHAKHTFASFLSRDTTYDLIVNIWKLSHPEVPLSAGEMIDFSEDDEEVAAGATEEEGDAGPKVKKTKRGGKLKSKLKGWKGDAAEEAPAPGTPANGITPSRSPAPGAKRGPHRITTCPCDKDKKHLSVVALDTTYPAVPEKMYNLMFTSGFMKEFWTDDQKLTDLQMSDWSPDADQMLAREITYIKPLAGGFGPKQTKCLLKDENVHVDFDEHVTVLTTTRTPDVPSGGSFSVKTRTCFTWAKGNTTKVYVTCAVDWSGRSMLKSIIDKACIDGQKAYYKDLDAAVRQYVKDHASEFKQEGDGGDGDDADSSGGGGAGDADTNGGGEKSAGSSDKDGGGGTDASRKDDASSAGGLGGILGALSSGASSALDMVSGALEPVMDLLSGTSPSTLLLSLVVILLLFSNLWSLRNGTEREPAHLVGVGRPARGGAGGGGIRRAVGLGGQAGGADTDAVADAVRDVLRDFLQPRQGGGGGAMDDSRVEKGGGTGAVAGQRSKREDAEELLRLLEDAEKRVARLRKSVAELADEER